MNPSSHSKSVDYHLLAGPEAVTQGNSGSKSSVDYHLLAGPGAATQLASGSRQIPLQLAAKADNATVTDSVNSTSEAKHTTPKLVPSYDKFNIMGSKVNRVTTVSDSVKNSKAKKSTPKKRDSSDFDSNADSPRDLDSVKKKAKKSKAPIAPKRLVKVDKPENLSADVEKVGPKSLTNLSPVADSSGRISAELNLVTPPLDSDSSSSEDKSDSVSGKSSPTKVPVAPKRRVNLASKSESDSDSNIINSSDSKPDSDSNINSSDSEPDSDDAPRPVAPQRLVNRDISSDGSDINSQSPKKNSNYISVLLDDPMPEEPNSPENSNSPGLSVVSGNSPMGSTNPTPENLLTSTIPQDNLSSSTQNQSQSNSNNEPRGATGQNGLDTATVNASEIQVALWVQNLVSNTPEYIEITHKMALCNQNLANIQGSALVAAKNTVNLLPANLAESIQDPFSPSDQQHSDPDSLAALALARSNYCKLALQKGNDHLRSLNEKEQAISTQLNEIHPVGKNPQWRANRFKLKEIQMQLVSALTSHEQILTNMSSQPPGYASALGYVRRIKAELHNYVERDEVFSTEGLLNGDIANPNVRPNGASTAYLNQSVILECWHGEFGLGSEQRLGKEAARNNKMMANSLTTKLQKIQQEEDEIFKSIRDLWGASSEISSQKARISDELGKLQQFDIQKQQIDGQAEIVRREQEVITQVAEKIVRQQLGSVNQAQAAAANNGNSNVNVNMEELTRAHYQQQLNSFNANQTKAGVNGLNNRNIPVLNLNHMPQNQINGNFLNNGINANNYGQINFNNFQNQRQVQGQQQLQTYQNGYQGAQNQFPNGTYANGQFHQTNGSSQSNLNNQGLLNLSQWQMSNINQSMHHQGPQVMTFTGSVGPGLVTYYPQVQNQNLVQNGTNQNQQNVNQFYHPQLVTDYSQQNHAVQSQNQGPNQGLNTVSYVDSDNHTPQSAYGNQVDNPSQSVGNAKRGQSVIGTTETAPSLSLSLTKRTTSLPAGGKDVIDEEQSSAYLSENENGDKVGGLWEGLASAKPSPEFKPSETANIPVREGSVSLGRELSAATVSEYVPTVSEYSAVSEDTKIAENQRLYDALVVDNNEGEKSLKAQGSAAVPDNIDSVTSTNNATFGITESTTSCPPKVTPGNGNQNLPISKEPTVTGGFIQAPLIEKAVPPRNGSTITNHKSPVAGKATGTSHTPIPYSPVLNDFPPLSVPVPSGSHSSTTAAAASNSESQSESESKNQTIQIGIRQEIQTDRQISEPVTHGDSDPVFGTTYDPDVPVLKGITLEWEGKHESATFSIKKSLRSLKISNAHVLMNTLHQLAEANEIYAPADSETNNNSDDDERSDTESSEHWVCADFDISQNGEEFSGDCVGAIMQWLMQYNICVKILKLYKNGVDDAGAKAIVGYLRRLDSAVPSLPSMEELHLSDNQITNSGGNQLIDFLAKSNGYPITTKVPNPKSKGKGKRGKKGKSLKEETVTTEFLYRIAPLWLRMDNNWMDTKSMSKTWRDKNTFRELHNKHEKNHRCYEIPFDPDESESDTITRRSKINLPKVHLPYFCWQVEEADIARIVSAAAGRKSGKDLSNGHSNLVLKRETNDASNGKLSNPTPSSSVLASSPSFKAPPRGTARDIIKGKEGAGLKDLGKQHLLNSGVAMALPDSNVTSPEIKPAPGEQSNSTNSSSAKVNSIPHISPWDIIPLTEPVVPLRLTPRSPKTDSTMPIKTSAIEAKNVNTQGGTNNNKTRSTVTNLNTNTNSTNSSSKVNSIPHISPWDIIPLTEPVVPLRLTPRSPKTDSTMPIKTSAAPTTSGTILKGVAVPPARVQLLTKEVVSSVELDALSFPSLGAAIKAKNVNTQGGNKNKTRSTTNLNTTTVTSTHTISNSESQGGFSITDLVTDSKAKDKKVLKANKSVDNDWSGGWGENDWDEASYEEWFKNLPDEEKIAVLSQDAVQGASWADLSETGNAIDRILLPKHDNLNSSVPQAKKKLGIGNRGRLDREFIIDHNPGNKMFSDFLNTREIPEYAKDFVDRDEVNDKYIKTIQKLSAAEKLQLEMKATLGDMYRENCTGPTGGTSSELDMLFNKSDETGVETSTTFFESAQGRAAREKREREQEAEKQSKERKEEAERQRIERLNERRRKNEERKERERREQEKREKEASEQRLEIRKAKGLDSIEEGGIRMLELYHNQKYEFWEAVGLPDLSDDQKRAVFTSGPVFVQGRSGTGKTTVLERRALEHDIDWKTRQWREECLKVEEAGKREQMREERRVERKKEKRKLRLKRRGERAEKREIIKKEIEEERERLMEILAEKEAGEMNTETAEELRLRRLRKQNSQETPPSEEEEEEDSEEEGSPRTDSPGLTPEEIDENLLTLSIRLEKQIGFVDAQSEADKTDNESDSDSDAEILKSGTAAKKSNNNLLLDVNSNISDPAPLSLFITVSPTLAEAIRSHYDKIRRCFYTGEEHEDNITGGKGASADIVLERLPGTPQVVSTKQFESPAEKFGPAHESIAVCRHTARNFSDVPNGPASMVVTFSEYLRMLDASIPDDDHFFEYDKIKTEMEHKRGTPKITLATEVHYERFFSEYWSKIRGDSNRKFFPDSTSQDVYRELMVIKGHGATGQTEEDEDGSEALQTAADSILNSNSNQILTSHPFSQAAYLEVSDNLSLQHGPMSKRAQRHTPKEKYIENPPKESSDHFTAGQREMIWSMFLKYQQHLKARDEWDSCDCSENLWRRYCRQVGKEMRRRKRLVEQYRTSTGNSNSNGGFSNNFGSAGANTINSSNGIDLNSNSQLLPGDNTRTTYSTGVVSKKDDLTTAIESFSAPVRGYIGRPVTCMLIDEAQDLLLYQILLFRCVCDDPTAYTLAADTAQCISAGRVFRFASLKDVWYRSFLRNSALMNKQLGEFQTTSNLHHLAIEDGNGNPLDVNMLTTQSDFSSIAVPDVLNLTQNYRTHQGVLNFASEIVRVLCHFWPKRIDKLPKERSDEQGRRPLLGFNINPQDFVDCMVRYWAEVGVLGESAILVKTHEQKKMVQEVFCKALKKAGVEKIGKSTAADAVARANRAKLLEKEEAGENNSKTDRQGPSNLLVGTNDATGQTATASIVHPDFPIPILTTWEAKGLEFLHVLVWNFFQQSLAPDECWYYLYGLQKSENNSDLKARVLARRTNLEQLATNHSVDSLMLENGASVLQTELKELYVAVTRVRKRLFLYEEKDPTSLLMLAHLMGRMNLEKTESAEGLESLMKERGGKLHEEALKLYKSCRYKEAGEKFRAAEDDYWYARCGIAQLKENLRSKYKDKSEMSEDVNVECANYLTNTAVKTVDLPSQKFEFLLHAAEHLEKARKWKQAHETYEQALKLVRKSFQVKVAEEEKIKEVERMKGYVWLKGALEHAKRVQSSVDECKRGFRGMVERWFFGESIASFSDPNVTNDGGAESVNDVSPRTPVEDTNCRSSTKNSVFTMISDTPYSVASEAVSVNSKISTHGIPKKPYEPLHYSELPDLPSDALEILELLRSRFSPDSLSKYVAELDDLLLTRIDKIALPECALVVHNSEIAAKDTPCQIEELRKIGYENVFIVADTVRGGLKMARQAYESFADQISIKLDELYEDFVNQEKIEVLEKWYWEKQRNYNLNSDVSTAPVTLRSVSEVHDIEYRKQVYAAFIRDIDDELQSNIFDDFLCRRVNPKLHQSVWKCLLGSTDSNTVTSLTTDVNTNNLMIPSGTGPSTCVTTTRPNCNSKYSPDLHAIAFAPTKGLFRRFPYPELHPTIEKELLDPAPWSDISFERPISGEECRECMFGRNLSSLEEAHDVIQAWRQEHSYSYKSIFEAYLRSLKFDRFDRKQQEYTLYLPRIRYREYEVWESARKKRLEEAERRVKELQKQLNEKEKIGPDANSKSSKTPAKFNSIKKIAKTAATILQTLNYVVTGVARTRLESNLKTAEEKKKKILGEKFKFSEADDNLLVELVSGSSSATEFNTQYLQLLSNLDVVKQKSDLKKKETEKEMQQFYKKLKHLALETGLSNFSKFKGTKINCETTQMFVAEVTYDLVVLNDQVDLPKQGMFVEEKEVMKIFTKGPGDSDGTNRISNSTASKSDSKTSSGPACGTISTTSKKQGFRGRFGRREAQNMKKSRLRSVARNLANSTPDLSIITQTCDALSDINDTTNQIHSAAADSTVVTTLPFNPYISDPALFDLSLALRVSDTYDSKLLKNRAALLVDVAAFFDSIADRGQKEMTPKISKINGFWKTKNLARGEFSSCFFDNPTTRQNYQAMFDEEFWINTFGTPYNELVYPYFQKSISCAAMAESRIQVHEFQRRRMDLEAEVQLARNQWIQIIGPKGYTGSLSFEDDQETMFKTEYDVAFSYYNFFVEENRQICEEYNEARFFKFENTNISGVDSDQGRDSEELLLGAFSGQLQGQEDLSEKKGFFDRVFEKIQDPQKWFEDTRKSYRGFSSFGRQPKAEDILRAAAWKMQARASGAAASVTSTVTKAVSSSSDFASSRGALDSSSGPADREIVAYWGANNNSAADQEPDLLEFLNSSKVKQDDRFQDLIRWKDYLSKLCKKLLIAAEDARKQLKKCQGDLDDLQTHLEKKGGAIENLDDPDEKTNTPVYILQKEKDKWRHYIHFSKMSMGEILCRALLSNSEARQLYAVDPGALAASPFWLGDHYQRPTGLVLLFSQIQTVINTELQERQDTFGLLERSESQKSDADSVLNKFPLRLNFTQRLMARWKIGQPALREDASPEERKKCQERDFNLSAQDVKQAPAPGEAYLISNLWTQFTHKLPVKNFVLTKDEWKRRNPGEKLPDDAENLKKAMEEFEERIDNTTVTKVTVSESSIKVVNTGETSSSSSRSAPPLNESESLGLEVPPPDSSDSDSDPEDGAAQRRARQDRYRETEARLRFLKKELRGLEKKRKPKNRLAELTRTIKKHIESESSEENCHRKNPVTPKFNDNQKFGTKPTSSSSSKPSLKKLSEEVLEQIEEDLFLKSEKEYQSKLLEYAFYWMRREREDSKRVEDVQALSLLIRTRNLTAAAVKRDREKIRTDLIQKSKEARLTLRTDTVLYKCEETKKRIEEVMRAVKG